MAMRKFQRLDELGFGHLIARAFNQVELLKDATAHAEMLVLTQAERADFLRPQEINLRLFVAELWDGVSLLAARRVGPVEKEYLGPTKGERNS